MFLMERLFGVTIYTLILTIVIVLLYVYKVNVNKVLKAYIVILSIMAFFFVPYITADLYRINIEMRLFSQYNFIDFVKTFLFDSTTPAADLLYYFVGRTGMLNLLPMIASWITYYCIFYIVRRTAEIYDSKRKDIALAVFFLMSVGNYMYVISNIRTMIAMSILCFCLFRESFEGKKFSSQLPLYLIAVLTHNLAVIIFCFRVILLIHSKNILCILREKVLHVKRKSLLIVAGAVGCLALCYLGWFFGDVIHKAMGYIFGETYSYIWEYIIATIALCTEIYVLYHAKKMQVSKIIGDKTPENLMIICLIAACVFCFVFTIFYRIIIFIIPTLIVPSVLIIMKLKSMDPNRVYELDKFRKAIVLSSVVMLFLSCFRGSLSSLKFFIL